MAASPIQIELNLSQSQRLAAAEILCAAFARKLRPILGSKDAVSYIAATLAADRCVVTLEQGQVVGSVGLHYDGMGCQHASLGLAISHLGLLRGLFTVCVQLAIAKRLAASEILVEMLAVRADSRGRGIGTLLLQMAMTVGRQLGKQRVSIEVVNTNPNARRLYANMGFRHRRTSRYPFTRRMMGFSSVDYMMQEL